MRSIAILALILASPSLADDPKTEVRPDLDLRHKRTVEGWKVRVHPDLIKKDKDLGVRALRELEVQLYQITRNVPPKAVEKLRQVTIWLEKAEPHHPCASLSPVPRGWLAEHDMNPDKARCVEIANASTFLDWTPTSSPGWSSTSCRTPITTSSLPEGFDNPDIKDAIRGGQGSWRLRRRAPGPVETSWFPRLCHEQPDGILRRGVRSLLRPQRLLPVQPGRTPLRHDPKAPRRSGQGLGRRGLEAIEVKGPVDDRAR